MVLIKSQKTLLSLSLFFTLIIGIFVGIKYQERNPKIEYLTKEKIIKVKEDKIGLLERCGDIPSDKIRIKWPLSYKNPIWAPDCRHVAWSVSNGIATSWDGPMSQKDIEQITPYQNLPALPEEGVFIYDDKTEKVNKIFEPKLKKDEAKFVEWKDSSVIIFLVGNSKFSYDLISKSTQAEK